MSIAERCKELKAHNGYWFDQLKAYKHRSTDVHKPTVAVVDGCIYHLKWEDTPFKGFGGHMFRFVDNSYGIVVECNNVWNGEEIPEVLRPLFPNTHEWLSRHGDSK